MDSIGDAWSFSDKTPITPSGSVSVETLTGITPLWKTKSNRSISTVEDRILRWLQYCYKMCCKKGGYCGRWACIIWRWYHCRDVISGQVDLHIIFLLSTLQQNILSITLESIVYLLLLLLRPNWGLLNLYPHLNYCYFLPQLFFAIYYSYSLHILVFFLFQFCFLFPNSYNVSPYVQNLYSYNNSCFHNLSPWHISFIKVQTLLANLGMPLLYSSS